MKEIKAISLERMNNGAHYLYMSTMLSRAESHAKLPVKAAEPLAALRTAVEEEDRCLAVSRKSLLTDDIRKADHERDVLFGAYRNAVRSYLSLPEGKLLQAARELDQHLTDYRIDPREQLDKETGLLVNFLADLETRYAGQVATLSLSPFVTGLKEVNERLRRLTKDRTYERMTLEPGALARARKASDAAYRLLVRWVNALALLDNEADYAEFIDYVNTEVVHYKREVLGQRAKAPSASAEQPDGRTEAEETPAHSSAEQDNTDVDDGI